MAKCIAVKGCKFQIPEATNLTYSVEVISEPEQFVKVCDKQPYAYEMKLQVSGLSTQNILDQNGENISEAVIKGTAFSRINHKPCIVEGDKVENVLVKGTNLGNPAFDTITVKIIDAGQEYVKVT